MLKGEHEERSLSMWVPSRRYRNLLARYSQMVKLMTLKDTRDNRVGETAFVGGFIGDPRAASVSWIVFDHRPVLLRVLARHVE